MKKLTAITISSVIAAAVLLGSGGLTVLADAGADNETYYPETFEASQILDYAVNGDYFAFATDKKIAVFGGEIPVYYEPEVEITALDCFNGEFCYKTSGGIVYDLSGNSLEYEISPEKLPVSVNGYSYTLQDGSLKIWDGNEYDIDGDFSNLKVYGNVVYAVNGNTLNRITPPQTAEPINYEMADFSSASQIKVGGTVEALDSYNLDKPHFTKLVNGEYLTEVYLDENNFDKASVKPEDYFKTGGTLKVGEENGFTADMTALVLCETGNAHIIALNGKFYLKLAGSVSARELAEPEFVSAQISAIANYVYSSPNLCSAVKLFAVSWNENVRVLGKLTKSTSPELPCDFYKVEYTDENETTLTGYIPCTFVVEKQETTEENKTDDPAPATGNNIKTVVLVLIVVVLVLIALGYITFVFTSDKKRKNK